MNQIDRVLQQLRGGPITSLQMIQSFGITRLATHILVLRDDGFDIRTELVTVKNRWGEDCVVARYRLHGRKRKRSPRVARLAGRGKGRPAPLRRARVQSRKAARRGRKGRAA